MIGTLVGDCCVFRSVLICDTVDQHLDNVPHLVGRGTQWDIYLKTPEFGWEVQNFIFSPPEHDSMQLGGQFIQVACPVGDQAKAIVVGIRETM